MEMNFVSSLPRREDKTFRLLNISQLYPVSFPCMKVKIKKAIKFRLELTEEQNERFRQFAGASLKAVCGSDDDGQIFLMVMMTEED
jgi:Helix-turn-helix domain